MADTLTRLFKTGTIQLIDPDPSLTPDEVRKLYAVNHTHLAAAVVSDPLVEGDKLVYEFVPPIVKTKG